MLLKRLKFDLIDAFAYNPAVTEIDRNTTVNNVPNFVLSDGEPMVKLFEPRRFKTHLDELYYVLLNWMLGKKEIYTSHSLVDDFDHIKNEKVVSLIIKASLNASAEFHNRLLQDLHLLLKGNQLNCINIMKNEEFLPFLLEVSFHYYNLSTINSEDVLSLSIFILAKKIFSDMIENTISSETHCENFNSASDKFDYMIGWSIIFKDFHKSDPEIDNKIDTFIKIMIFDILENLKKIIKVKTKETKDPNCSNFFGLTILFYEYLSFGKLKMDYAEIENVNNRFDIPDSLVESFVDDRKLVDKVTTSDFEIMTDFYYIYSILWNKSIFETGDKFLAKNEKLVKEYLEKKSSRDQFLAELEILSFNFRSSRRFEEYDLPLIKVINNFLTIAIKKSSTLDNIGNFSFWLDEYERFLMFVIIASSNVHTQHEKYNYYAQSSIQIIIFGIGYLNNLLKLKSKIIFKVMSKFLKRQNKICVAQRVFFAFIMF